MKGSSTWVIPSVTPVVLRMSASGPMPMAWSMELTTPVSWSSTSQANVRAMSDVQNGSSTSAIMMARVRWLTLVNA